jgi:hypothetical protein
MQLRGMPAVTLSQLQSALGTAAHNSTFFIEPGASFTAYINEVGPRLYSMGPWRDLLVERSYSGANGYISLDRDIDAVWKANVNDRLQRVRSMFHDMSFFGTRRSFIPEHYGLVDLGEYPVAKDFVTIQDVSEEDELTPITTLHLVTTAGVAVPVVDANGFRITITGTTATGTPVTGTINVSSTNAVVTFATGITRITSITSTNLAFPVDLRTDVADGDTLVASLRAGTDVVRYRRFLVSGFQSDSYVHILAKRGWVPVASPSDLISLGNLSAWKHALLGKVAEDNADVERAEYHWGKTQSILDSDLSSYRGGAKPVMHLDLYGGAAAGIRNLL